MVERRYCPRCFKRNDRIALNCKTCNFNGSIPEDAFKVLVENYPCTDSAKSHIKIYADTIVRGFLQRTKVPIPQLKRLLEMDVKNKVTEEHWKKLKNKLEEITHQPTRFHPEEILEEEA